MVHRILGINLAQLKKLIITYIKIIIIKMSSIISTIEKKQDWQKKLNDPLISEKWSKELRKQGLSSDIIELAFNLMLNNKHNNWKVDKWPIELEIPMHLINNKACSCECLICSKNEYFEDHEHYNDNKKYDKSNDEAKEAKELYKSKSHIKCNCKSHTLDKIDTFLNKYVTSCNLFDDKIKNELFELVNKFQSSKDIDYHPNSNNQVIDIVHPSMYCYIKGITKSKQIDIKVNKETFFQWLPCEVTTMDDKSTFNSYINNLPRKENAELYETIGSIFNKFKPKFETLLDTMQQSNIIKQSIKLDKCQIIVKLSNTVVTADNPNFNGGSWHLEGLPNEHIVATGIYYYKMENISENYLNFRTKVNEYYDYPQDCHKYVNVHYGLDIQDREVQNIIDFTPVETKEDLCLIFPNFLQHKVSDFKLIDPTKDGTRNILCFFLIDPSKSILSTKDVRPQYKKLDFTEAKLYEELLMYERKAEVTNQNQKYEEMYSLCEH
jgi:hypothetical protein